MSIQVIFGRVVTETAGPIWHLLGSVERDNVHPNQLILTRKTDNLSPNIRAMNGRTIQSLTITDPKGSVFNMANVRLRFPAPLTPHTTKPKSGHPGHTDTNELETIEFTFATIAENSINGKSAKDKWTP